MVSALSPTARIGIFRACYIALSLPRACVTQILAWAVAARGRLLHGIPNLISAACTASHIYTWTFIMFVDLTENTPAYSITVRWPPVRPHRCYSCPPPPPVQIHLLPTACHILSPCAFQWAQFHILLALPVPFIEFCSDGQQQDLQAIS